MAIEVAILVFLQKGKVRNRLKNGFERYTTVS